MKGLRPTSVVQDQLGVTLVELLVALVMGLVLLAGVATVFLANKETYRSQEALARVQENGRFALAVLTRDLRLGGHRGCATFQGQEVGRPVWTGTPPPWQSTPFADFARPVEGFEFLPVSGTWDPALDAHFTNLTFGPVSDVLMVTAFDGVGGRISDMQQTVIGPNQETRIEAVFVGDLGIPVAQYPAMVPMVIVSDCINSAVLPVASAVVAGASPPRLRVTGIIEEPLLRLYPSAANAAEVQRLGKKAYYVAPTTAGEPALWRWDGAGAAQEMVEGVERLEVLFGVDANGDQEVDRYDTAQQVNQSNAWPNVISVRIAVLVRSGPGVIPTNAAQRLDADLDGAITCPDECFTDGRLRQVFTTTVALRNRLS